MTEAPGRNSREDRSNTSQQHDPTDPLTVEIAQLRGELSRVEERASINDKEIDLLQLEAAKKTRPWYREPAALVATLALLTSIVTGVLTQLGSHSDRDYERRTRLTAALEEISATQAKNDELKVEYGDRAPQATVTQVSLLTQEAERLSNEVETEPFERVVIANSYIYVNDLDNALKVAQQAKSDSTNPLDLVEANRAIAQIYYSENNLIAGRATFVDNAQVSEGPRSILRGTVKTQYMFENNLNWARSELTATPDSASCSVEMQHATAARQLVPQFPPAQQADFLKRSMDVLQQVNQVCPHA